MPKRVRRLWLEVRFKVPPGISREVVLSTLKLSILEKNYSLPIGWQVVIAWRNKENAPMKYGPWKGELVKSAASSDGFDKAVLAWLDRQQ